MKNILKITSKYSELEKVDPELLNQLYNSSGKNHKYFDWICKNFKDIKSNFNFSNQSSTDDKVMLLSNFLLKFDKYSSKLSTSDIYQFSFLDLKTELDRVDLSASDVKKEGSNHVFEDENFLIIHPTTYDAHKLYAAKTKWCTTSSESTYNQYNNIKVERKYHQYNFLLIYLNKQINKKYALYFSGEINSTSTASKHRLYIYDELDEIILSYTSSEYEFLFKKCFENGFINNNLLISSSLEHALMYATSLIKDFCALHNFQKYKNLLNNYNNIIMSFYRKNDVSTSKVLDKHYELETFSDKIYKNILMVTHDEKCKSSLKINEFKVLSKDKTLSKLDKELLFLSEKLKKCSCNKFINLEFLNNLKSKILKDKMLKNISGNYDSIIGVIDSMLERFDILNLPKKDILKILIKKSSNNLFIFENISLSKEELLFLQVFSEDQSIRNICANLTKAPNELAEELLILKKISSVEDL